ncbi:hypothetical protein B0H16DRAFT_270819 [Mycena metata]|uniref:Uncharacterized protein n=1 Tax=Mycena metata TaxID=1033252 RepID=A0AAD7HQN4_9AGAR|nr:hypothetical protein B0H16DRAFT_270819 [Mycena metata]
MHSLTTALAIILHPPSVSRPPCFFLSSTLPHLVRNQLPSKPSPSPSPCPPQSHRGQNSPFPHTPSKLAHTPFKMFHTPRERPTATPVSSVLFKLLGVDLSCIPRPLSPRREHQQLSQVMVAPSKLFPSAWSSSFTLLPANSRLTRLLNILTRRYQIILSCHQVVTFKVPGNVKNAVNACLQHHKYIFPVDAVTVSQSIPFEVCSLTVSQKRLQVELPF